MATDDLRVVLDSCSFIFEQAAYYDITSQVLSGQLEKSGVTTQKISAFEQIWESESKDFVAKLRSKTLAPLTLDSINWRLHLQIGQSSLSRLKEPSALLELGLTKDGTKTKQGNLVRLEFSHEKLYDFFQQLEVIQVSESIVLILLLLTPLLGTIRQP